MLTIVTLALGLSWVGCNKSGKLDTTSKFKAPAGPVELKLKWPVSQRIVLNMDMKQNMEIFMPNQPGSMKQDMTMGQKYALTVLKEDASGGHEVEMEFLSARMSMVMGGKTMLDYDSDKKPGSGKTNPMAGPVAAMFQKIIGAKIQYSLDASNEVEKIEGVDELVDRLSSGGQADALAPLKSTMFSKDHFKQMMSANRFMPPKAVQPGDTWPVKQSFEMGPLGTMVINFDCTFQNWEQRGKRTCARIEFQGTLKSTPSTNANPTGMSMSILDGNSSGVSWFDPELGITIDMTMNQDIKMAMTMPVNARGNAAAAARTQTMTNIMSQVITMKLDSVK
jgi:hypothetical protein